MANFVPADPQPGVPVAQTASDSADADAMAMAPIPWRFRQLTDADSTNTIAAQIIRQHFQLTIDGRGPGQARAKMPDGHAASDPPEDPHGLIILAQTQRAGRGQYGRSFASPPGGLYASAIIANLPPVVRGLLSLAAGLAVALTLEDISVPHVAVRWPNDVLAGSKKVAGILCEAVSQGPLWAGVVGIGVNVNTPLSALPPELTATATSVLGLTGKTVNILSLARAIFGRLEDVLRAVSESGAAWLIGELARFDALAGRTLTLRLEHGLITGTGAGISQTGCLKLYTPTGLRQLEIATIISVDGRATRPADK